MLILYSYLNECKTIFCCKVFNFFVKLKNYLFVELYRVKKKYVKIKQKTKNIIVTKLEDYIKTKLLKESQYWVLKAG